MSIASFISDLEKRGDIPPAVIDVIKRFCESYTVAALKNGYSLDQIEPLLRQLAQYTTEQIAHPFQFQPFHESLRSPVDYYAFGLEFIRPLIDLKKSALLGEKSVKTLSEQLKNKENVVLFANHQIEPDPQVISLLLEKLDKNLAEKMIFVAGHRVTTDPLAIPFSLGRNLLCIYSKRHIEHPPEQKTRKLAHNQETLKKMQQLLKEGGCCIFVAPSGGRDRPDAAGVLRPSPFDPDSIELFHLLAKKAQTPTHFYPLAVASYHILPPPSTIVKELGEQREAAAAPVFLSFGEEIDMQAVDKMELQKAEKRKLKADLIFGQVNALYNHLSTL